MTKSTITKTSMSLKDFVDLYPSRKEAAKQLGIEYHSLSNTIGINPDILKLENGKWIITNKGNRIVQLPQGLKDEKQT